MDLKGGVHYQINRNWEQIDSCGQLIQEAGANFEGYGNILIKRVYLINGIIADSGFDVVKGGVLDTMKLDKDVYLDYHTV